MTRFLTFWFVTALIFTAATANAVSISVYNPETSGISAIAFSEDGNVLTVATTWSSDAPSFLVISGLTIATTYTLQHAITNNSGVSWTRFANELLDPAGQPNDSSDPSPQPSFVPPGFSTSNDLDGLSFAQGQNIPRTSSVFAAVQVDELTDARDFLDFYNGQLSSGNTDSFMTFGLRDNGATPNQPFLLSVRPNVFSVPEPSACVLMAFGFALLIATMRRSGKSLGNARLHR